jgi:hypothetical protein
LHVLLFVDAPATEAGAGDIEDWLYERWAAECERHGLERPERWAVLQDGSRKGLGVNVAPVRSAEGTTYIAFTGLASETAGATSKVARGGNRSLWQLLMDVAEQNDGRSTDVRLWREWVLASKGRAALTWSCRQLRAQYGLSGPATDAELVEAAGDEGEVAATVSADVFHVMVRRDPGWPLFVLEVVEDHGPAAALEFLRRCTEGWGGIPPPSWWKPEWTVS